MLRNLKHFNPPEIEEKVLQLWKEKNIFQKSIQPPKDKKVKIFRFWEGPPTANGRPGIHHVLARSFKDVVLRFKTMQGYIVPRKGGWDTHGLPVEIQVEKQLGFNTKKDIENYGIAEFNQKCKESAWLYKSEWRPCGS
jgi:isoleucyl-tRNA synthetase